MDEKLAMIMTIQYDTHRGVATRRLATILLATIGLWLADSAAAQSSQSGTGELIGIREIRLKPEIDPDEFDRFVAEQYNPSREGAYPGLREYIAKAKRGKKAGTYIHFVIFDAEKVRDLMFPGEEGQPVAWVMEILEKLPSFEEEFERYVEGGAEYFATYTDYVELR